MKKFFLTFTSIILVAFTSCTVSITSSSDDPSKPEYKVQHYQQNIADDEYTLIQEDTQTLFGEQGEQTAAQENSYTGFEPVSFDQEQIAQDSSTVVKIYYNRKIVSLAFDLDGGTTTTPLIDSKLSGKYGAPVAIQNPTKTGTTFKGWNKSLPQTFSSDDSFVALWDYITYTISFNGNSATSGTMDDINCTYGQIYTIPENLYTKTDYNFIGWYTSSDGTGTSYSSGTDVSKLTTTDGDTIVLYAQWSSGISASNLDTYLSTLEPQNEPYEINIADTNPDLTTIKTALQNHSDIKINLDLSKCTSLTTIENASFNGCSSLISITIPSTTNSINKNTFKNCTNLKSITIPVSVTSIADAAFNGCTKLTQVNYTGTAEQWASITIGNSNNYLKNAIFTYNYVIPTN